MERCVNRRGTLITEDCAIMVGADKTQVAERESEDDGPVGHPRSAPLATRTTAGKHEEVSSMVLYACFELVVTSRP